MTHLAKPDAGAIIVPITQPVYVEGARIQGSAIALSQVGDTTYYLIVATNQDSAPVWASDSYVDVARLGAPPESPES